MVSEDNGWVWPAAGNRELFGQHLGDGGAAHAAGVPGVEDGVGRMRDALHGVDLRCEAAAWLEEPDGCELLSPFEVARQEVFVIAGVVALLALFVSREISRRMGRPIQALTGQPVPPVQPVQPVQPKPAPPPADPSPAPDKFDPTKGGAP